MGAVPQVRPGVIGDVPLLTTIYNHYVLNSNVVFDEKPSSLADREDWFRQYREHGPYRILVATENNQVLGWASSQVFRSHPAFKRDVETTIILHPSACGRGVGRTLYDALFAILATEDVHRATPQLRCVPAGGGTNARLGLPFKPGHDPRRHTSGRKLPPQILAAREALTKDLLPLAIKIYKELLESEDKRLAFLTANEVTDRTLGKPKTIDADTDEAVKAEMRSIVAQLRVKLSPEMFQVMAQAVILPPDPEEPDSEERG